MAYKRVDSSSDWVDAAKRLPLGGKRRVVCCGSRKSALTSRGQDAYFFCCFSCDKKEVYSAGLRSIQQVFASRADMELEGWRLPRDFTLNLPATSAVVAYRSGLSNRVLRVAGIGWSGRLGRIVVPMSNNWHETNWIARATLTSQKPKWLGSPSLTPWMYIDQKPATSQERFSPGSTTISKLCIVEDAFSAVRVSKFIPTMPIFGTSSSLTTLASVPAANTVLVWLDGDGAGKAGALNLCSHFRLMGRTVHNIRTPLDPKMYSDEEIRRAVNLP